MTKKAVLVVLGFLLLSFVVSSMGAFFQPGEWYKTLQKPFFTPPNIMFPIVWTILYILMALAASLIFLAPVSVDRTRGLKFYFVQLALNACWSFVFFGQHWIELALVNLILLLMAVILTMKCFLRVNQITFWLLVPYFVWGVFALMLNAAIVFLN